MHLIKKIFFPNMVTAKRVPIVEGKRAYGVEGLVLGSYFISVYEDAFC
jgi:hypothetical protein